jgi:hypothetical protein
MSWLDCPVLVLRQTSIADMRLVNCYSRSVLGPSSLPSQFTEVFGMAVKEAEAVLYAGAPQRAHPSYQPSIVPGFGDL